MDDDKLKFIEQIMLLMKENLINEVTVGDIKITKIRHILESKTDIELEKEKATEILFASAGVKPPKDFDMSKMFTDPFQKE